MSGFSLARGCLGCVPIFVIISPVLLRYFEKPPIESGGTHFSVTFGGTGCMVQPWVYEGGHVLRFGCQEWAQGFHPPCQIMLLHTGLRLGVKDGFRAFKPPHQLLNLHVYFHLRFLTHNIYIFSGLPNIMSISFSGLGATRYNYFSGLLNNHIYLLLRVSNHHCYIYHCILF